MAQELKDCRVAILATHGFEQVELTEPRKALEAAGARAEVVAPQGGEIQGWNHREKGDRVAVDRKLDQASAGDYDALMLPGGVVDPDALWLEPQAVAFVRAFARAGKPIAAICHGPWTLVDAGAAKGRRMTSWPSLQADLANAGASWVDEEVVVDGRLLASRNLGDLPAFCRETVRLFADARRPQPAK